jgi:hypothetical protein
MLNSNRDVAVTARQWARRFAGLLWALAGTILATMPLRAQEADVTANDVWAGVTGDIRIAPRALITFTSEERRTDGARLPRQFFVFAGLMADVGHGIRAGGGMARYHTSPNEELGVANATDENRVWQQLTGSHLTLGAAWNHRTRFEERWIAPVAPGGGERNWDYSTRLRHQLRIVAPLDGRPPAASRIYALPSVEVFLRTTKHEGVLFEQTRLGVALGIAVAPRLNLETGYLRQGIVHNDGWLEVHHVLQVTARVLAKRR